MPCWRRCLLPLALAAACAAPALAAGASDCAYFRNAGAPCYGVDPAFAKPNDSFMHGVNERLLATEIPASLSFWHDLLVRLATPGATTRLSATRTGRVSISMQPRT